MTTISVTPDSSGPTGSLYRARAGEREGVGPTVGDAVKAVTDQMGELQETTLIVVQPMKPDRFFTADQIRRLGELMARWRAARDAGTELPAAEQSELEALVRAELQGATERARAMAAQRER